MSWVTDVLREQRQSILDRWLEAVAIQPFHRGRRERAISDDIPRLFDALVHHLSSDEPVELAPDVPLDDPAVLDAARAHARTRASQGLKPADVLTEFRLLRRELRLVLSSYLPETAAARDAIIQEHRVVEALDGVIAVGIVAFSEQLDTVREDFVATTVHEARHPITVLRGTAQFAQRLLRRAEPNVPRIQESLATIEHEADQLADLLDAVSETSRAAQGLLDPRREAVNLVSVVQAAVGELLPEAGARVTITAEPDFDVVGEWDPEMLRRVLTNLLSNAVKYSTAGTPIVVDLAGDDDLVRLRVSNEGLGIAPEELPRLFQRYVRTRASVELETDGLGLGLYLCRMLVESQGGRIWAESVGLGQGATFHVELPRLAPDEDTRMAAREAGAS